MALEISRMVEDRLLSTVQLLKGMSNNIIANTKEEILAINGFEGKKESELTTLEKSYLADLIAIALLRKSLDRYKEDAKSTDGPDGLIHEAQNKLAYLQDMITRYENDAAAKASKLGLGPASGNASGSGTAPGYSSAAVKIRSRQGGCC